MLNTKKIPLQFRLNVWGKPNLNTNESAFSYRKIIIVLVMSLVITSCSTPIRVNGVTIKTRQRADKQERAAYVMGFIAGFAIVAQVRKDK